MSEIIVPVSLTRRALDAVRTARRLALQDGATVHLVHVASPGEAAAQVEAVLGKLAGALPDVAHREIIIEIPVLPRAERDFAIASRLAAYATRQRASMVVMADGTQRSSEVAHWLVHQCPCPVLAVRRPARVRSAVPRLS